MSKIQEMQAAIAAASETADNMTEVQKGAGGRLLPAGYAFGRLVEYIELGNQPQEFNGVAKDPAPEFQLGFALWGEGYQNEDGTPYILRPYSMARSRNDKARAFLLFKALNWKGTAVNFGQLLTESYLVKIVHVPKSKSDPKIVSRIDLTGFLPPLDPVTRSPYPIPEAREEDIKFFFWDTPTPSSWADMFIDGAFENGDSKNTLQEKLIGATNYSGSALEAMLTSNGLPVPVVKPKAAAKATAPATPANAAPALPAAPSTPAAAVAVPLAPAPAIPAIAPAASPATPAPASTGIPALPAILPAISPSSVG